MTRVHVFCEGQTEEVFVRDILRPHFERMNIWMNPIIIRTAAQKKGGVSTYGKIRRQITKKCKEDPTAWVTTLLDFYGLPKDAPGMADNSGTSFDRGQQVTMAFQADIDQRNFIAYLIVHEYEGLLFSAPDAFGGWFDDPEVVTALTAVRNEFNSPEHIDGGVKTTPSKRILATCDQYDKVNHGALIALDIGLDTMRRECLLFDGWVRELEALSPTQSP